MQAPNKINPKIWADTADVFELLKCREASDLYRAMSEFTKQVHSPKKVWDRLKKAEIEIETLKDKLYREDHIQKYGVSPGVYRG